MNINRDRLLAFYQVAISKNFHKAAEYLCITQPALSQRVLKLEQELETTLFIRGHEGVTLTDAGTMLLDYARSVVSMEQEVLARISGKSQSQNCGILRIAAYSSILRSVVIPALKPIIEGSQDIHVEFFSRELHELPLMLKSGEVDFILLDYIAEITNFDFVEIGVEELVHVRHRENNNPRQAFLDHDALDMTTYRFFKSQGLAEVNLKRCFYDDIYGIIDGVSLGLGQAVVSGHLVGERKEIRVVPHDIPVVNPVVLYYHRHRYLPPLHREVIEHLTLNARQFLK